MILIGLYNKSYEGSMFSKCPKMLQWIKKDDLRIFKMMLDQDETIILVLVVKFDL